MSMEGIYPDEAAEMVSDLQRSESEDPGYSYLRVELDITVDDGLQDFADLLFAEAAENIENTALADALNEKIEYGQVWIDKVRKVEELPR